MLSIDNTRLKRSVDFGPGHGSGCRAQGIHKFHVQGIVHRPHFQPLHVGGCFDRAFGIGELKKSLGNKAQDTYAGLVSNVLRQIPPKGAVIEFTADFIGAVGKWQAGNVDQGIKRRDTADGGDIALSDAGFNLLHRFPFITQGSTWINFDLDRPARSGFQFIFKYSGNRRCGDIKGGLRVQMGQFYHLGGGRQHRRRNQQDCH